MTDGEVEPEPESEPDSDEEKNECPMSKNENNNVVVINDDDVEVVEVGTDTPPSHNAPQKSPEIIDVPETEQLTQHESQKINASFNEEKTQENPPEIMDISVAGPSATLDDEETNEEVRSPKKRAADNSVTYFDEEQFALSMGFVEVESETERNQSTIETQMDPLLMTQATNADAMEDDSSATNVPSQDSTQHIFRSPLDALVCRIAFVHTPPEGSANLNCWLSLRSTERKFGQTKKKFS